jgi:hypothetical protein
MRSVPMITSPTVVPQRISPLATLHSKVARFSAAQAVRTIRTARISSTVSITMMGVEESISVFRRCKASAIEGTAICLTGRELLTYNK